MTVTKSDSKILDLGSHYVSDFVLDPTMHRMRKKYPLDIIWNLDWKCATLVEHPPSTIMWGKYWYRSGTNETMKAALKNVVDSIQERIELEHSDVWLDIASNDGTLLSFVPKQVYKVGIDPCEDSFVESCQQHADVVVQDYFNLDSWHRAAADKRPKIVTSIAMFYDLQDPVSFAKDVYNVLDDHGVWVLQLSYTPLMLEQMAFDNICHEHFAYHSLESLVTILGRAGFKILDATLNDVNGGSLRVYAVKADVKPDFFGTVPFRYVANLRVNSLLQYEESIDWPWKWECFGRNLLSLKEKVTSFIVEAKSRGKSIWAYGASTKGNTLLQYFGLDYKLIDAIAERSPSKYGLYTIGTSIPIVSEDEMRCQQPDYLLILPWHFIKEFVSRESEYLNKGGSFIIPCPEFKVLTKDGYIYENHAG